MGSRSRCYLNTVVRVINVVLNGIGVAMIIYSLWFLKKWKQALNDHMALAISPLPTPWFIYTCLGVGIIVCLSTLVGHMTANCTTSSTLAIYFVLVCCLLLIQAVIIVTVFLKIDWSLRVSRYIDRHHQDFKSFVLFHVSMCRLLSITVLVAQVTVTFLAAVLQAVGCETSVPCSSNRVHPDSFTYSFLEDHDNSLSPSSSLNGPDYGVLPERIFKFNVGEMLRRSFHLIQAPKEESTISN